jgi:hypothetical protein
MFTPNVSKNNDDNGNGKRLGTFLFQQEKDWALFCFNCALRDAEVGGDLLFAAQITAGIILNAYP